MYLALIIIISLGLLFHFAVFRRVIDNYEGGYGVHPIRAKNEFPDRQYLSRHLWF